MSSIKPGGCSGKIDGAEKVYGAFIIAGGDRAERFESGEEVLDQMPRLVQVFIVYAGDLSVGLGRDDDGFSRLLQWLDHPFIGIKGLIGNDRVRINAR